MAVKLLDEDEEEPSLGDDDLDSRARRRRHAAQWRPLLREQGVVLSHDSETDN